MKANTYKMPGIAAFSDEMRDALRGPFNDNHQGAFLAGLPGGEESIKFGIVGAIKHPQVDNGQVNYSKAPWAEQPTQMISYVSCHDDMCLVDRLKASLPGITPEELARLDKQTAEAFGVVRARSMDPGEVTANQGRWRRTVRDICADEACIEQAYQTRLAELN